jgi:hypothetical protein
MLILTAKWTWLGWVAFFFAWLFVVHGVLLVLHEVGGHGVAEKIFACGVERIHLTYFGGGSAQGAPCPPPWTMMWTTKVTIDMAGLAVTLPTGAVAMAFLRRAGLTPPTRLLLALFATHLLLSELGYATSGGYFEVYDPGMLAASLDLYGYHVLAWLPPLVGYAAAAVFGARAIVDALRKHFGSRTRLQALKQSLATLGVAELLFVAARRIEAALRTDTLPSIAVAAEQRAIALQKAPWMPVHRFPIQRVLVVIAVAAFVAALARPVVPGDGGQDGAPPPIPRRYAMGVAGAALLCAVTITLLGRV